MNPRVLAWLRAAKLTPSDIERGPGEDTRRVTFEGRENLWTAHYVIWIGQRWREWAWSLGFTRGSTPHHDAWMAGHPHAEFDAWLEKEAA
jgi:hypothetical protein